LIEYVKAMLESESGGRGRVPGTLEKKSEERGQTVVEMVAHAISHRIRVQILFVLNEGIYSPTEVAEIIDVPLNSVSNHMRSLADRGSIEIVDTRMRRNAAQHFYRATQVPEYSKEDVEAMTIFEAQVTAGLIIQSLFTEVMASLRAGRMSNDPGVCLCWDRLHVDEQGRREVAEEQEASWHRLVKIEEESLVRAAESGEETVSYVTSSLGFERARKAPRPTNYSPFGE
jgi:DNA-binding transcriptional ArsR family regulator